MGLDSVGNAQHGLDGLGVEGEPQCIKRHPRARVRGNLQGPEVQAFQDHEEAEQRGRLQRHHVTRLRDRAQAQRDGFQAAVGDEDVARVQLAAQAQRMARDGAAQAVVTRPDGIPRQRSPVAQGRAADGAAHALLREQVRAGAGSAEGDAARVVRQLHDALGQRTHVDGQRTGRRVGGLGLRQA
jgi:hypothetical protein